MAVGGKTNKGGGRILVELSEEKKERSGKVG